MANDTRHPIRRFGWQLLLYALALGLLLAGLQTARYRFLLLDHAQERYIGVIALLFTIVGIWAGRRLSAPQKRPEPAHPTVVPDGAVPETVLAQLNITPREYEVLQLIAQGLSNQEIAGRLFVSLNTVKTHTANLFAKLDVQRRTQAVQKARALGLLPADHPKV